jgi:hypothetical protein
VSEGRAADRRLSGDSGSGSEAERLLSAVPCWMRTGYKYFPYAARQSDQWWVLRANYCFPEHDLVTLFVDGRAVGDITASDQDTRPLAASIAALDPIVPSRNRDIPAMPAEQAESAVATVAAYVEHGSELDLPDPCDLCEFAERDPYERDEPAG